MAIVKLDSTSDWSIFNSQYISEIEKFEKEMARFDQLHTVAKMGASIAHEVRNPMTTVRGLLQMLGDKEDCQPYKEYFDLMIEEIDAANAMISEYLSLTKVKPVKYSQQNLNRVIKAISPLIAADATKSDQELILELEDIPDCYMDSYEVRRLILNLARNGLEAMDSGGKLKIRTRSDGRSIVLSIIDQGHGIPQEIQDRIGTPFFTTKEQGTGLGLTICYGIATRHNAVIDLVSSEAGTTFSVNFNPSGI